jgi:hypothetical protein
MSTAGPKETATLRLKDIDLERKILTVQRWAEIAPNYQALPLPKEKRGRRRPHFAGDEEVESGSAVHPGDTRDRRHDLHLMDHKHLSRFLLSTFGSVDEAPSLEQL